jgi:23S rRNA (uracil1939-C5)-methyltransferase
MSSNEPARARDGRVEPRCPHFGICGGCDSQTIAYDDQRRLKRDRLVSSLEGLVSVGRIAECLDVRPAGDGPRPLDDAPWQFRHKVHFVFGEDRGRLLLAHHARGGRHLVFVRECPAHVEEGNRLAEMLREALETSGLRAYPHGPLRHVIVRSFRAGTPPLVTLVLSEDEPRRLRRAIGLFAARAGGRVSVSVNVNEADTPYLLGRETRHVAGPRRGIERIGNVEYLLSASSFFQTNVDGAEALVRWLFDRVNGSGGRRWQVVDLYAGVGLFALPLAAAGHRVLAVEENPGAVVDGLAATRRLGLSAAQCRFVQSPVRRVDAWARHTRPPVDLLIVDPPREGVGPGLLTHVLSVLSPRHVAYISCDPTALARDLAAIMPSGTSAGYTVDAVQPLDMFPHTTHLEAAVWLRTGTRTTGTTGTAGKSGATGPTGTGTPRRSRRSASAARR